MHLETYETVLHSAVHPIPGIQPAMLNIDGIHIIILCWTRFAPSSASRISQEPSGGGRVRRVHVHERHGGARAQQQCRGVHPRWDAAAGGPRGHGEQAFLARAFDWLHGSDLAALCALCVYVCACYLQVSSFA